MQIAGKQYTGAMPGHDGIQLFVRHFSPSPETRAGLVITHGLGEHSGRYITLARGLSQKGISVVAFDHRGHGQSGGKRGHVTRFSDYIRDMEHVLEKFKNQLPAKSPVYILGHSMGGLIVLNFAMRYKDRISGVIASSPALAPAVVIPCAKAVAGKVMSRLWQSLTFDNELEPEYLSHEKTVVDNYVNDPLVHRRISARLFTEMMNTMQQTRSKAALITIPVLMQVAGADRFVDPESSRNFFNSVTAEDKTLRYYEGLFHEIYNEAPDRRQKIVADLENWLQNRIP